MTDRDEALAGRRFGDAADAYVAGRPEYPAEIVEWLVQGAPDVADVGAGTGKLTAALVRGGRTVDRGRAGRRHARRARPGRCRRRARCRARGRRCRCPTPPSTPSCTARRGTGSTCRAASAEAARVLRPGGALGLIWNVRDSSVDWVDELGEVIRGSAAERMIESDSVAVAPPFGPLERMDLRWTRPMTVDELVAMAASRSYVIALSAGGARRGAAPACGTLIATHPDDGRPRHGRPPVRHERLPDHPPVVRATASPRPRVSRPGSRRRRSSTPAS